MNAHKLSAVSIVLGTTLAFASVPDVKYTQVTTVKFHGALGTMMKLAGGSGPQTSTIMVNGNKQRQDSGDHSTIIDLDRELVITIDHKKKEYSEMTFDAWREMMRKLQASAGTEEPEKPQGESVEWKFDAKVDRTGERQTMNGYPCEKVILTLALEAEKKSEAGTPSSGADKGGMVVTSTNWMTPQVPGWEEAQNFAKKLAEKLGMGTGGGVTAMLETAMRNNPRLDAAFKRMAEESKKLNGVAVKTESVFETWGEQSGQAVENQQEEEKPPTSVGGLLGGLGKKMAKKPSQGSSEGGRQMLFESGTTLQSVSIAAIDASLFAAPATYKKKSK